MYVKLKNGRELIVPMENGAIDLGVKFQWRFYGADAGAIESVKGKIEQVA